MDEVRILRRDTSGWAVLVVSGVVDVATAADLRQALIEAQQEDGRLVALDLDGVDLLDSFGIGVIVGALKRASARGGEVAVVCSRSRLVRLFRVTRLDEIVRMVASVEELGAPGSEQAALD